MTEALAPALRRPRCRGNASTAAPSPPRRPIAVPYAARMQRRLVAMAWIAILGAIAPVFGQTTPGHAGDRTLVAGICELPPFSFKLPNGDWDGMAVQVWSIAAKSLGLRFEWRELSLDDLYQALEAGTIDIAVTGVPVDSSRARRFNFSQPFESSAVVIATRSAGQGGFVDGLRRLATSEILIWLALLIGAMVAAAITIAILEHRRNPHFPKGIRGIGEGLWWSVTTFSTVGYGDRVPITRSGRAIAAVWMLVAFALMTILSGLIASSLTVGRLNPVVQSAEDLRLHAIGALDRGMAAPLLRAMGVHRLETFPSAEAGLRALRKGQIQAFVGDSVVLRFMLRQRRFESLIILPGALERNFIALGLSRAIQGPLRDSINEAVLEAVESPAWADYLEHLLGAQ